MEKKFQFKIDWRPGKKFHWIALGIFVAGTVVDAYLGASAIKYIWNGFGIGFFSYELYKDYKK